MFLLKTLDHTSYGSVSMQDTQYVRERADFRAYALTNVCVRIVVW